MGFHYSLNVCLQWQVLKVSVNQLADRKFSLELTKLLKYVVFLGPCLFIQQSLETLLIWKTPLLDQIVLSVSRASIYI